MVLLYGLGNDAPLPGVVAVADLVGNDAARPLSVRLFDGIPQDIAAVASRAGHPLQVTQMDVKDVALESLSQLDGVNVGLHEFNNNKTHIYMDRQSWF